MGFSDGPFWFLDLLSTPESPEHKAARLKKERKETVIITIGCFVALLFIIALIGFAVFGFIKMITG